MKTQTLQFCADSFENFATGKRQSTLPSENCHDSPILEFYKDETVFITGATGFLGALLVEKLLRCCQIRKLILLVRSQGSKSVDERLIDYFNQDVFDTMRTRDRNYYKRVTILSGALEADNYGLTPHEKKMLTSETSIVFHVAATVRFDEHIRTACNVNVKGTQTALEFARKMPRLKSFVHVSTVYSNCDHSYIEEKFYSPAFTATELSIVLGFASDVELSVLNEQLLGERPNTYTLTKATAEDVVREWTQELPVCIFRPSIVFPTIEEPLPLWFKGLNGVLAFLVVGVTGILRVFLLDTDIVIDIVPGDRTINALTALAWYQTTLHSGKEESKVFNYVSCNDNRIHLREMVNMAEDAHKSSGESCSQQAWVPDHISTKNSYMFFVLFYTFHCIPALLFSVAEKLANRKPLVMKVYRKFMFNFLPMTYFAVRQWEFENTNTKAMVNALAESDRKWCDASLANFRWESMLSVIYRAGGIYFFKMRFTKDHYQKRMVHFVRVNLCLWAAVYALAGYTVLNMIANQINAYYNLSDFK